MAATDQDAGTSLVYSIIGGADAAKFHVDASTGVLSFVTAPNFEAPTDSDHNSSYIVQVGASDGSLFDSQTITVNVTNVNEPPKDFNGDGYSDLLWQNDNGTLGAWDLNDQQILHSFNFTAVSNDWHIAGTGDFNGDAHSDLLWRSDNGTVGIWDLNDQQVVKRSTLVRPQMIGTSPAPVISTATPRATSSGATTMVRSGSGT